MPRMPLDAHPVPSKGYARRVARQFDDPETEASMVKSEMTPGEYEAQRSPRTTEYLRLRARGYLRRRDRRIGRKK